LLLLQLIQQLYHVTSRRSLMAS